MASTGFIIAGTGANLAGVGTEAWVNPGNITASDGSVANADAAAKNEQTNYLVGSNFVLNIPLGSTINGIEAKFRARDGVGAGDQTTIVRIVEVRVAKDNSTPGDDLEPGTPSITKTLADYTYGSATELWGLAWTAADVNGSTFQVRVSMSANSTFSGVGDPQVDAIWVNVHYTPPSGRTTFHLIG